jgi:hypothetical protein
MRIYGHRDVVELMGTFCRLKLQMHHTHTSFDKLFKAWVSELQTARSYYAARGHVIKLCIYCKNYTII